MSYLKDELRDKYPGIINECIFTSIRSSGPGGQNVNKVSSKVELRFNISQSRVLSDREKIMILERMRKKINKEGELILTSQTERSRFQNKLRVTEKFLSLLHKALVPVKKRVPTTPTRSSKQKKSERKRKQSEKKKLRNPPEINE